MIFFRRRLVDHIAGPCVFDSLSSRLGQITEHEILPPRLAYTQSALNERNKSNYSHMEFFKLSLTSSNRLTLPVYFDGVLNSESQRLSNSGDRGIRISRFQCKLIDKKILN